MVLLPVMKFEKCDRKSPRFVAIKVFVFGHIQNLESLIKISNVCWDHKGFEFDYVQNSKS